MDKISTILDGEGQPVKLNNVTLGFEMTDGGVTWKLTWSRDASGIETYTLMKGETAWSSGQGDASNKQVTVTGLPAGTWELKSESTPNGYTMPESAVFTMGNDGTISSTSGSITAGDDKLSIRVEDEPTGLTLVKKGKNSDGTLKKITGGYTFSIDGKFRDSDSETIKDTRYIGTIPSGKTELADGMLLVSDTSEKGQPGWQPEYLYELKEEKAPAGYKLSEYNVFFYLDKTGNVAIYQIIDGENNTVDEREWEDIAQTDNTNGATIEFIDEPFELTLLKTDNNTVNPEKLAGAEFSLGVYNSTDDTWSYVEINGIPVDGTDDGEKLTTDENGIVTLPSQDYGLDVTCKYRITETKAPDGFSLPSTTKDGKMVPAYTMEFEFDENGMLTTGGSTLTFTDAPISISIIKKDATDKETLSNVDFELYIVDQNGQETKIDKLTTDGDGRADIPAVKMAYGNTYRLYELANPGYIEQKTLVYAFTVNPDGTITPEGEFAGSSVADKKNTDGTVAEAVKITLENERILGTLTVTKVDKNTDEKLEGAEFALYKALTDSDGKPVVGSDGKKVKGEKVGDTDYPNPAVTNNDGVAVFNDLEWGDYILEETKAPDGYERRTDTWDITIGRKGTDIVLTVPETIWNTKNRISFQKYADGGEISLRR
ncbi:MAG: SpaA isopeptide-forming pilin-related protein [Frisingicoccus sp.]